MELGLERAGMKCLWQVEQDEFCLQVLQKHWPNIPKHKDVREVSGDQLEPVDLLFGGFPCQDISGAGKGEGIEGPRSSLWFQFARLIGELRPGYVFVENVAILRRRGLHRVVGDLARLGYNCEWDTLRASDFGAPHQRARLWLVAYKEDDVSDSTNTRFSTRERTIGTEKELTKFDNDGGKQYVANQQPRIFSDSEEEESSATTSKDKEGEGGHHWAAEPGLGRGLDGVSSGLDTDPLNADMAWERGVPRVALVPNRARRIKALGNSVVPQIAEYIGHQIIAHHVSGTGKITTHSESLSAPELTRLEFISKTRAATIANSKALQS
jgi:DNA (cytosine-5)-methyltransferase 1